MQLTHNKLQMSLEVVCADLKSYKTDQAIADIAFFT
jgi:hypothetical protein